MTIASQTTAETMLGDGANRKFPFTFRAWEDEVNVVLTDPEDRNTDVTGLADIQIAKDSLGGVVTYPAADGAAPLPSGWKLTVLRNMNFLQAVRLVNATRYDPLVIEQALDRLTATDQQLKEQSERALAVAIGAATIPQEVLDQVFEAKKDAVQAAGQAGTSATAAAISEARADQAIVDAEAAVSLAEDAALAAGGSASAAADSAVTAQEAADGVAEAANLARAWAQNPEDEPVRENPDTGAEEYSAYHWARKAQEVVHVEPTSETVSGIVRLGTAAEHAAGLNGVAAQPGRIRTMLFAGSGAGPKLREDILPVATNATLGGVKPDGSTITIDAAGIISASGGGGGGVPSGVICLWSGAVNAVPDTWALCNGQNGTPDLRDRFIVGAGAGYAPGATGGAWAHAHTAAANPATISGTVGATTLTTNQIPSHGHSYRTPAGSGTVRCLTTVTGHTSSGTDATTIGYTGGGASHTHSLSSTSHSHDVTVNNADSLPPFYALAYIMKL